MRKSYSNAKSKQLTGKKLSRGSTNLFDISNFLDTEAAVDRDVAEENSDSYSSLSAGSFVVEAEPCGNRRYPPHG